MEIFTLLEAIEDVLENCKTLPFSNRRIVDKDEILDIVREIRLKLPDDLKQAKWVREERNRIIQEAKKEGEDIVKEAENRIIAMIDEHEITKKAYDKKTEIIADANEMYREITKGTNDYVDGILANIENNMLELGKSLSNVEMTIQNAVETIQNNRKELK